MIDVSEATGIFAKLASGGRITPEEREELDDYASRFKLKEEENGTQGR